MTDAHAHVPTAPETTGPVRGRRALLTAGATAALGALGVVVARPAEAAAGSPLLLGRPNSSGATSTVVTSSTTGNAFSARASAGCALLGDTTAASKWGTRARNSATVKGTGGALLAEGGVNDGLEALTRSNLSYGVQARNDATTTSKSLTPGAAVRAEGRHNSAVIADTLLSVTDVPAMVLMGGDGEFDGTALVAGGTSYLDGNACALRSFVGVLGTDPDTSDDVLQYAPVVSGEKDFHVVTESVTLDGVGNATVDLVSDYGGDYAPFVKGVDLSTLRISLTPIGGSMPNLYADYDYGTPGSSFSVAGGTASGTVHFTVTAQRIQVTLSTGATAAAAAGTSTRTAASAPARRAASAPVRLPRQQGLPRR